MQGSKSLSILPAVVTVWGSERALRLADALEFAGRSAGLPARPGRHRDLGPSSCDGAAARGCGRRRPDAGPTDASDSDSDSDEAVIRVSLSGSGCEPVP
jgi:hypothetical protein